MSQLPPLLPVMLPPLKPTTTEIKRRGKWYFREYEPGKFHLLCNGTYTKQEMLDLIADLTTITQRSNTP